MKCIEKVLANDSGGIADKFANVIDSASVVANQEMKVLIASNMSELIDPAMNTTGHVAAMIRVTRT